MNNSYITSDIFVVDANNKKIDNFPFNGSFSNEINQKQKICDENGSCKLTL
ncbi:hypothetical protein [Acinetobacter rudis]|uniref:hypothetical protein n=1 Tax=Acinetobacter rudis TaxID=632955 RepID=UPI00333F56D2